MRALVRTVTLSIGLVASVVGSAASQGASRAAPTITANGVGKLRLGTPLRVIRREQVVGSTRKGCELASPPPIVAQLSPPLKGTAIFSGSGAHLLQAISITGGARTDKGVGVGDPASKVLRAYPSATVQDAPPGDPLPIHAISLARGGKTVLWFELKRAGGRVSEIDIPSLETCE